MSCFVLFVVSLQKKRMSRPPPPAYSDGEPPELDRSREHRQLPDVSEHEMAGELSELPRSIEFRMFVGEKLGLSFTCLPDGLSVMVPGTCLNNLGVSSGDLITAIHGLTTRSSDPLVIKGMYRYHPAVTGRLSGRGPYSHPPLPTHS
jgi:hypothetical protein